MITSRTFPHVPGSVPAARHFVGGLVGSASPSVRQDVEVMASELVSNCIRHTGSEFAVTVDVTPESVRVEVTDSGGGTPAVGRPPPSQPTGRGLQIVDLLADDWGVTNLPDNAGKTVWFVLALLDRPDALGQPSAATPSTSTATAGS